eukprot:Nitzschia sp. Nitz4//scaffold142_size57810//52068//54174//NITZ4_006501-RA/size57810-processed-gene-0.52-mRNA-1//1//CDS//3329536406//9408//frame0
MNPTAEYDLGATFQPQENDGYALIQSVETTAGKQLLHPMKILFPEGTITAILGPSGAGKSTLLSILTDSLSMNSKGKADIHLPGLIAMVPQEDRLHGFYTVKSYMMHYARLAGIHLPASKSLNDFVDDLIASLGLTEQADTIVGDLFLKGLSGGQKRRLSIALEALSGPSNFFLDEPTSGLDAESAFQVMEFLQTYVKATPGRRVILTIHQPSSFIWKRIENVVLLSKGQLVYQGSRVNMEAFFAKHGHPTPIGWNPADHYVTMVNDEFREHTKSVEEWARLYTAWEQSHHIGGEGSSRFSLKKDDAENGEGATSDEGETNTAVVVRSNRSSGVIGVAFELTYRYFLNLWFNPGILLTRVAMYSMLALMVGGLFWDLGERNDYESILSRTALCFYCVAFFIFMSVAVLPFTVMERDIVDKEVLNSYYHPVAYQVAQGLASLPGAALLAGLVSLIILTMTKFNDPGWYFLNMFLALTTSEALAQLVSHVVPHFVIGMALIAGLFGFFMLFQGFMIIPSDFPNGLRWTYDIAFHTYSWRSFMVTEFRGLEFPDTPFPTGEDVLVFYEIEDTNRGNDMLVLACYTLLLHILSFVVLHIRYMYFKGVIVSAGKKMHLAPMTEHSE